MREKRKTIAYISLGSNQGDSVLNLEKALEAIQHLPGVKLVAASATYYTEPQNMPDQPFFANQVAAVSCAPEVTAEGLLHELLAVETRLGRKRDPHSRFGPRVIDLDLLLFGREQHDAEHLTLPHPRMLERAFVLVPLAELVPDLPLPHGETVRESLARLTFSVDGKTIMQSAT